MMGFKPILGCLTVIAGAGVFTVPTVYASSPVEWIDGTRLPIEGRPGIAVGHYYDRLPENISTNIGPNVHALKHHTSGMQFRFKTTSETISFRWVPYYDVGTKRLPGCVYEGLGFEHMPANAVSGIDVYRRLRSGKWEYVKTGFISPGVNGNVSTGRLDVVIEPNTPICVNLPLYNGIRSFELGVSKGATVSALPERANGIVKPVVFYGTSITQGGCASRPGMAFVNIVGRELDVPVVNLGFSGGGKMEFEMSEELARVDASCYVLDALANMWEEKMVAERYEPFIRNLRKLRPDTPIVMAEQCNAWNAAPERKDVIVRELYEKLVAEGWKGLAYLPKAEMFDENHEGSVDGCHASDVGMQTLACSFGKAIRSLIDVEMKRNGRKSEVDPARATASIACADVVIGRDTKWREFGEKPLYMTLRSKSACKVAVDGKFQGWMAGGDEMRCFELTGGRGCRPIEIVAADTNAEIEVDFVSARGGVPAAEALTSVMPVRCVDGDRWLYKIPSGKTLTFTLDGRARGFPTASVFCERAGKMIVRWGDRQVEVVGRSTGYLSFDAVALGDASKVEFIVKEGEFHLGGVGFTRVTFPPTVAEMQEMCQRLCDKAVAEGLQGGVQFCAYRDGRKIVDVCAGHLTTNADSAVVTGDTLFPIFSTEKPLLSTACHRAVERGLMDYDKPLCTWWPEFTGDGKEKLTLRETLAYRTSLPGGRPGGKCNPVCDHVLSDCELCDWKLVCRVAAADKPHGVPGTIQAYLPYAYAWMIGHPLEVAMKKPLKQVLDEEVLIPSGIEKAFYFIVPRSEYPRVAKFYYGQFCENMNEDWARQALMPSAWAVSSADALCRFYNRLCGFDGRAPLIRKETLDAALKPCRHPSDPLPSPESMKRDWFMLFGMGYGLWGEAERMDRVFGHGGAGGSEALVDRDKKLVVAFTCNFCKNCNPLRDRLYEVVGMRWRYWNGGVNIQDLQMTTSSGGAFGAGITSH